MDHRIIVSDVLDGLATLADGSCRGVVTSPPYNLLNSKGHGMNDGRSGKWKNAALMHGYGSVTKNTTSSPAFKAFAKDGFDGHHDNMPHGEYVEWQRAVLTECMRVTEHTGAIFYNHTWRPQGGLMQDRADIVAGFPVRQIIIWKRSGGFNFNDTYFLPTYQVIYLIAKPGFRVPRNVSNLGDVWEIRQDSGNPHPAPFPVDLASRCIRALGTGPVLDPFVGSGTTAVAAERLGIDSIGIELSARYAAMARERVLAEQRNPRLFN